MKSTDDPITPTEMSAASLSESYRRFARAIGKFSDFQGFCHSLSDAVESDPYLQGDFLIEEGLSPDSESCAQVFEKGRVVLPMSGAAAGGFLRLAGRKDQRPFGAEDLRLMGSMADFVAALYGQAKEQRRTGEKIKILQFLIDQLPLGILCFDGAGELVSGNMLAWKQLGLEAEPKDADQCDVLLALKECVNDGTEAHFEVGGRLLFAARRSFDPGTGVVSAYVIYDLSNRRDKLLSVLEREFYKAKYLDAPVTVALLESKQEAGALYRELKGLKGDLELNAEFVQPMDAHACACVFPDASMAHVRRRLAPVLKPLKVADLQLTLFQPELGAADQELTDTLEQARREFQDAAVAMSPRLLVLDAYEPVADTLDVLLDGAAQIIYCSEMSGALSEIEEGLVDCVLIDLDTVSRDSVECIRELAVVASGDVRLAFTSARNKSMLRSEDILEERDVLLQKPFDASSVLRALKLKFNLA